MGYISVTTSLSFEDAEICRIQSEILSKGGYFFSKR